ncbi:hypothetical protein ACNKHV_05615 [Shigella flexneri]
MLKVQTVELTLGVEGYLRAPKLHVTVLKMQHLVLNVGDDVEAKYTGVDRENR